jgi:ABC-type lipoprotein release transport system permease subunit
MLGSLSLLSVLGWRNLWRHKRRTTVILFALILGVWSMVVLAALIRGSMEQHVTKEIANLTGHIQIHAPGYRDDPAIEHRMSLTADILSILRNDSGITRWVSRIRVPAVVASERESVGVTLVGIDPEGERGISFIPKKIISGRYLKSGDDPGLLMGAKLVERLETELGRRVVLMSQNPDNEIAERGFRIVGIFQGEPLSAETAYVFIGRRIAQEMLVISNEVSETALMTPDRNRLDPLVTRLRQVAPKLEIHPWTELKPLLVLTESVHNVILLIWFAVVFAAMSFGLINTLLMAVFERTREFGLFQALGMPPSHILGQMLVESLALLLIGMSLGNFISWATIIGLSGGIDLSVFAEGLEMVGMSPVIYPALSRQDVFNANAIVLVLGIIASLYPAWRASRYVPIDALTRN